MEIKNVIPTRDLVIQLCQAALRKSSPGTTLDVVKEGINIGLGDH